VIDVVKIKRLSTGIPDLDKMLCGGVPEGFFVTLTGEPGTGKTVACLHFIWAGLTNLEKCIYVTTEESRESIIRQAAQFGMDFKKAIDTGRLIIIDALMKEKEDEWSLREVTLEELIRKVIEAKKELGSPCRRLVIDSLSAFWLKAPSLARQISYDLKRILNKWRFTIYATSQYAITTGSAFGWGAEHIADGIIRFKRSIRGGRLRRYIIIEKMRQTPHDLRVYEINIVNKVGLVILRPLEKRVEDYALPEKVMRKIREVSRDEDIT